ncbi:MAG: methyltransferase [Kiritimatiellaeota bacterium]|nr:methyltransferase [Kiritimatiellota bacterium]
MPTHTIRTTDLPVSKAKAEFFADKRFRVLSHSGLHITEALLIQHICARQAPLSSLLLTGNRTGALAMIAAACHPGSRITCHALDLHHARAILRNLGANGLPCAFAHDPFVRCAIGADAPDAARVRLACTSGIPAAHYDLALFAASAATTTGELLMDQIEATHARLNTGGTCVIAYEGDAGTLIKQIRQMFGNLSAHTDTKGLFCVTAVKRAPLAKPRTFRAEFTASLPGGAPITLASLPGVFCHRRADMGGLALAEIAAHGLQPGQRILDLGCGCGLVGLLLAAQRPDVNVTFVDSDARALDATRRNLDALGLSGHPLVLSDTGITESGFDMLVGNPPYFSDFRIAQLFVDTAAAALRPGGTGLLVAKSPAGLHACVKTRFADAAVIARRGYSVIRFTRQKGNKP